MGRLHRRGRRSERASVRRMCVRDHEFTLCRVQLVYRRARAQRAGKGWSLTLSLSQSLSHLSLALSLTPQTMDRRSTPGSENFHDIPEVLDSVEFQDIPAVPFRTSRRAQAPPPSYWQLATDLEGAGMKQREAEEERAREEEARRQREQDMQRRRQGEGSDSIYSLIYSPERMVQVDQSSR